MRPPGPISLLQGAQGPTLEGAGCLSCHLLCLVLVLCRARSSSESVSVCLLRWSLGAVVWMQCRHRSSSECVSVCLLRWSLWCGVADAVSAPFQFSESKKSVCIPLWWWGYYCYPVSQGLCLAKVNGMLAATFCDAADGNQIMRLQYTSSARDKARIAVGAAGMECMSHRGATRFNTDILPEACSSTSVNQTWIYDAASGLIRSALTPSLCLDDGGTTGSNAGTLILRVFNCSTANNNQIFAMRCEFSTTATAIVSFPGPVTVTVSIACHSHCHSRSISFHECMGHCLPNLTFVMSPGTGNNARPGPQGVHFAG